MKRWLTILIILLIGALAVAGYFYYKRAEHAGTPVEEHTGEELKTPEGTPEEEGTPEGEETGGEETMELENTGKEMAQAPQQGKNFRASEIKAAMVSHIAARTKQGMGKFMLFDPKTKKTLELQFVKVHDPVRKLSNGGYFACSDFAAVGDAGRIYDLDFWLTPKGDTLTVTKETIHKEPTMLGKEWVKKERYTFEGEQIVEIN